jgi:predicted Zn finger-like uncharacterized protein
MIIECEGCRSKFNLNEALLKREGSKVRCSVCKNVFTAYPPEPETGKGSGRMELEETVALDSPPILAEREESRPGTGRDVDFDQAFQKALDEEVPAAGPMDGVPGEEDAVGDRPPDHENLDLEEPDEEAETPRQGKKSFRALPVILILVLILLAGTASVYYFAPGLLPESLSLLKPPQKVDVSDMGVARLSFANVKGGFVQSDKEGQLFVIQGVVTNHYPKGRSFILVKGSLLDDKGQVVKTKLAYAGNVFAEEQLKTMSIEEINKELKNRAGRENANARVKAEGQIPFSIVIESLPENLSEFTVEAVSSSPEPQ